ncbi:carboxypeptidase regulatory-like domain-containing protein [Pseudomarimonas salicorniae]|uniref:M64 family metallo-endopeptidase n=1 Tax=Pseudomarimonas salicorniae TaxID=2933270 RepID=A0ABT0GG31_9GAMM|nr:carboxypeptidase regulatory-like domain-containing protein [Lysobacter sp. CAU 1642]MCK7593499.1 M64 family metallo-endopeptidase [Lysobacter sp. CAU 1642]
MRIAPPLLAFAILCLAPFQSGAQPPPEPREAVEPAAGTEWIGPFAPRGDVGRDRLGEAVSKQAYRPDPRIEDMLGRALRTQDARWMQIQQGADAVVDPEFPLRYLHHVGSAESAIEVVEAGKSTQTVRVRFQRAADAAPVAAVWVFNSTIGRFFQTNSSGEISFESGPVERYSLSVAPSAPLAMRTLSLEIEAGRTDYTVALEDGDPLTLRYTPRSGVLSSGFYAYYSVDGVSNFARWVGPDAVDRIALLPGAEATTRPVPPSPHYFDTVAHYIGQQRGELTLPLDKGVLVDIPIAGTGSATAYRERSGRWFSEVRGSDLLRLLVVPGEPMRIAIQPPPPGLPKVLRGQRFDRDLRIDPAFDPGVALDLELLGTEGQAQSMDVSVSARDFHSLQRLESGARIAVPHDAEVVIEAGPRSRSPTRHKGRFAAPGGLSLRLAEEGKVSGRVLAGDGSALGNVRVQALQAGRLVASDTSDGSGRYTLTLPVGEYALHAFFEGLTAPVTEGVEQIVSIGSSPAEVDLTLPRPATSLVLNLPSSCHGAYSYRVPISLTDASGSVAVRHLSPSPNDGSVRVELAPGRYQFRAEIPGYPAWEGTAEVPAAGSVQVSGAALEGECRRWTGQLLDADGQPVPQSFVRMENEAHEVVAWARTDGQGHFSLPISPGFAYGFSPPESGRSLRKVRVIERRRASFAEDVRLEGLDFAALPQPRSGRQLIYGDAGDPDRFDIVFMAEGYVATQERFEDRNGNGLWDGLLFADLDRNGLWDRGEPYTRYGTAAPPSDSQYGTDIRSGNEPFEDLNGDGYPSIDDPSVFGLNIRNFVRELLSLPFWAERRDAINAWALWYDSEQAGMDLIDREGKPIETRNTAFGARWLQDRSLLAIDYSKAEGALARDFPQYGQRVVLLNQPVAMGRANAWILYYGGLPGASPVSTVASHELGHSLGLLADEYQEFRGNHLGVESAAPNLTRILEPDLPRWPITAAGPGPHPLGSPGDGWFEGAGYYQGGIFRPSHQSTMHGNRLRFNGPSLAAMKREACARLGACERFPALRSGVWWHPDEPGWGVFIVDQGDQLAAAWFTYAEDGRPTWFLLPATPEAPGQYRAPVLRFSGTPLASIGPGSVAEGETAGEAELRFAADGTLEFGYRVGAAQRDVRLQGFPFAGVEPTCRPEGTVLAADSAHVSDVWWNPDESGWGLFLQQRGQSLFAAWYTYAEDGSPVFLVATAEGDGEVFTGPVFLQRDGTPFSRIDGQPASPGAESVGEAEFRFDSGRSGRFSYRVGDVQQEKRIERLQFGSAAPVCGDR